ncbi:cell surface protein [Delftia sp. SD018]|uniref:cell surface protein n=1 Tax=unclassified Delftia TaxID=2613839 RepID=UPI001A96DD91|nr:MULTISPECIES: cell surface protein [unclassified Delftia]MBO0990459.1 cell surface protein [Delftia sp. SD083]MBO1033500.1 cell surface protein [Delftia sp. SD018]
MKKNVLALSIAAMVGGLGFAGAASAGVVPGTLVPDAATLGATNATGFQLTEGGTGHNLVVPYFSAQNGNMTVLHLVNTDTQNGKAVKVRFRGAANSDDLMDFQVFLSPQDVFTAAVTQGANGILQLVSSDNTCTLPRLNSAPLQATPDGAKAANAVGFFNGTTARLNPKLSADALAAGSREGYVEIFNMADIPSAAVYNGNNTQSNLYKTIKHNAAGVAACDSTVLNPSVLTTDHVAEGTAAAVGLATPTTGLMGDWYIMNVPQTTTFSGAATALTAVDGTGVAARGNFVLFPQRATAVTTAVANNATADPLFRTVDVGLSKDATTGAVTGGTFTNPVIRAGQYDLPDMSTPYFAAPAPAAPLAQAEALSRQLAVTSVINQYANDTSISGKTDWVFSMPTRRYSVALNYNGAGTTPAARVFSAQIMGAAGTPFFHDGNTEVTAAAADARICVTADGQAFYGREEQFREDGAVLSPGQVAQVRFCGETSVLSFADAGTSVLGATVARQDTGASAFMRGWANANVANGGNGLPILGASFQKLTNPSAGAGFSGTYGITWPHRATRVAP